MRFRFGRGASAARNRTCPFRARSFAAFAAAFRVPWRNVVCALAKTVPPIRPHASFPLLPRPARRQLSAFRRVIVLAWIWNAFIEHHRDVAAERGLNFHCDLRRNERARAVDVVLKFNTFLSYFAQFREREDLVTAAVGKNRSVPTHEIVQTAKMLDDLEAGPDEQVISVTENDLCL